MELASIFHLPRPLCAAMAFALACLVLPWPSGRPGRRRPWSRGAGWAGWAGWLCASRPAPAGSQVQGLWHRRAETTVYKLQQRRLFELPPFAFCMDFCSSVKAGIPTWARPARLGWWSALAALAALHS